jgi:hypothetical protein
VAGRVLRRARDLLAPRRRVESKPFDFTTTLSEDDRSVVERSLPYSLTGTERIVAAADAVRYIVRRDIPGVIVECGVWRGGSVLAMILTLQQLGVADRDIYLYDTFAGMTEPTEQDVSQFEEPAVAAWSRSRADGSAPWAWIYNPEFSALENVQGLLATTGYPQERLHFVVGPVEETIPAQTPEVIALLRLDTDWYESTRHELEHLYHRLSDGGVLIVDDYGHWEGCRRAVDEFFAATAPPLLLSRIDYTGRMAVKH